LKKTSKSRLSAKEKLPTKRKRRDMADGFEALHEYFYGLPLSERERFVEECKSTLNSIQQVMSRKVVGSGLAEKIERASKRKITRDMLCDTPRKARPRDWRSDKRHVKPGRDTPGFAAFRAFINAKQPEEREEFAKACGITVHSLNKILWRGKVTYNTALKIEKVSKEEITRDMLCPNWQERFLAVPKMSFALPGQKKKKGTGRKYADSRVDAGRDTPGFAAFRAYFNALDPIARSKFADKCETSVAYIRLALNRGTMSPELALKIERASDGEITRDMLYPDWKSIWPDWKPSKH
jgi:DNA-binding transcriptional regulator YdaS (Cro superfamily)